MKTAFFLQFLKKQWRLVLSLFILAAAGYWSISLITADQPSPRTATPTVPKEETINPNLNFQSQPLPNLTSQFIHQSLEKLITNNEQILKNGQKDLETIKLLPEEKDVEKIIDQIIDNESSFKTFNRSEIFINEDDSKETQIFYLMLIDYLIKEAFQNDLIEPNASFVNYFDQIASKTKNLIEVLKTINVPPTWVDIHIEIVNFFLKQERTFRSLASMPEDPLRFLITLYKLAPINIEKEFSYIETLIKQKIENEKIF